MEESKSFQKTLKESQCIISKIFTQTKMCPPAQSVNPVSQSERVSSAVVSTLMSPKRECPVLLCPVLLCPSLITCLAAECTFLKFAVPKMYCKGNIFQIFGNKHVVWTRVIGVVLACSTPLIRYLFSIRRKRMGWKLTSIWALENSCCGIPELLCVEVPF